MRAGWLSGLALFAIASASVLACTFIVDGQFKDFSGTCQISGIGNNVCGQCVARKCQTKIDGLCTSSRVTSDITSCVQNPAPGRNWNCSGLVSPAALDASVTAAETDLNHCVAACTNECLTCTTIDAGSGVCGSCITQHCAPLLNGNDGCCDNSTVSEGIAKCTAPVNPSCSEFRKIVGSVLDSGTDARPTPVFRTCKDDGADEFAQCVLTNCDTQCP